MYLHGPVGRGKSWLADAWFSTVGGVRKKRVHFHAFLEQLHGEVFAQRQQGSSDGDDALSRAFDALVGDGGLLLFDEFHVHDPGDALLLTRLLEHLLARETALVVTSNYAPQRLMPSPLWHHLFAQAIGLIERRMSVVALDGPVDYRELAPKRSHGFASGAWVVRPPGAETPPGASATLVVRGRRFEVDAADRSGLRASFAQLCEAPLSAIEYLEWARAFERWTITDVPPARTIGPQAQQRLVNLVDVLADVDVPAVFASVQSLDDFVSAAGASPDTARLASRLRLLRGGS